MAKEGHQAGRTDTLQSWLETLRERTLMLGLLWLGVLGGVVMIGLRFFLDPLESMITAGLLVLLALAVWRMRRWSYLAAAVALIVGSLTITLYLVAWSGFTFAIILLVMPVGLAVLTISRSAGFFTALLCSGWLCLAPAEYLAASSALRGFTIILLWSTLGMLWLTLNPLVTAVQWSWDSYEKSWDLLEEARGYQLKLQQALEDLGNANTQLARLNQRAQQLRQIADDERRAKEEFVANVSHELRTPLNMIVGFCEMITQAPEMYGSTIPSSVLADLSVVLRNGQHLASLIDDVLDLSQIEADQMALSRESVSLRAIVNSAIIAVEPLFQSKGLDLSADLPESIPDVFCDPTRIREVLLNLLSNAGRFTEEGGVYVSVHRQATDVVVTVWDTGPGIAKVDQERIFQPFQQLDNSIRRRYGGTGLGLSISRSFVELHGGRMWMESEVGEGTAFHFTLPLESPSPASGSPLRWLQPDWEFLQRTRPLVVDFEPVKPRILVVEPGLYVNRMLSRYLDGVETIAVGDLQEAGEVIKTSPVQCLVVNNLEIADVLRRIEETDLIPEDLPVFVSSIPGAAASKEALNIADYLVKPISRTKLLAALKALDVSVETVLLVDDDPDALRLFRRMLLSSDTHYRIIRAASGEEAWRVLHEKKVDALLLDLVMPGMDGFQLLSKKNSDPALRNVPVILISARDPVGQPIVSKTLSITRKQGLNARELLDCFKAFRSTLAAKGET
jgi:signal transduction histidine kinase/CheY-like chemotaxis protein